MQREGSRSGSPAAEDIIAAGRQILEAAYYSFLTTLDERGLPTSRLLQHFDPDPDLTLRVGTSARSRKVAQIEANPAVLVACQSPGEHAYVCLSGTAVIIRDRDQKAKYWREPWRAIWPAGPEGDEYLVIEIQPRQVEVVDMTPGSIFTPSSPAIVVRAGDGWRVASPTA